MRVTDEERQQLLADARRLIKETNFCADLCLRIACEAEHKRLGDLAATIRGHKPHDAVSDARDTVLHLGNLNECSVVPTTATIIPFPVRRFARDRRGVAALEFALILPIMLALYFGATWTMMAMAVSYKLTIIAPSILFWLSR